MKGEEPMKKFLKIIAIYFAVVVTITLIVIALGNKDLAGCILLLGTFGTYEVGLKNKYLLK